MTWDDEEDEEKEWEKNAEEEKEEERAKHWQGFSMSWEETFGGACEEAPCESLTLSPAPPVPPLCSFMIHDGRADEPES